MTSQFEQYANLFDDQTWAFIKLASSSYPKNMASLSLDDQRLAYNKMRKVFAVPRPKSVVSIDRLVDHEHHSVPIRTYSVDTRDAPAHVLYFHGGGFIVGNIETHDDICAEICDQTGFDVTAVDYRLSPENPHPAPFQDATAVFNFVAETTGVPIVLSGDSAGGTLCGALIGAQRGETYQAIGQVLVYPSLGLNTNKGSYIEHANAPMLTVEDMQKYYLAYSGGVHQDGDATFLPLLESDFTDIPPTVVISAQCDPLSDDGRLYCEKIGDAKGLAIWLNETGLPHAYLRARHRVDRAGDSFKRIVNAIQHVGNGHWPY
ncbi:MAG: acetyl esterase [Saprospiraceae bacterium]|jgi:acetyl esterase